jgi:hypothetical protein
MFILILISKIARNTKYFEACGGTKLYFSDERVLNLAAEAMTVYRVSGKILRKFIAYVQQL